MVRRWSHVKRVALALPTVFAAAAASVALLVVPMLSGHQSPQAAEAQRLTPALMRNVPTIQAWRWTVTEIRGQRIKVHRWQASLGATQRVYVYYGQVYFWSKPRWLQPAADLVRARTTSYDWQWAFALLNRPLATHDFTILPDQRIEGVGAEGIRTTLGIAGQRAVTVTFWVQPRTGLVLRLERDLTAGNREVEHDVVDYQYQRT
jgi:hypothetical protein